MACCSWLLIWNSVVQRSPGSQPQCCVFSLSRTHFLYSTAWWADTGLLTSQFTIDLSSMQKEANGSIAFSKEHALKWDYPLGQARAFWAWSLLAASLCYKERLCIDRAGHTVVAQQTVIGLSSFIWGKLSNNGKFCVQRLCSYWWQWGRNQL